MKKYWALIGLCILVLAGCASGPIVDRSLSAKSQASRVNYIIIHYTVLDLPASIKELVYGGVSSHYLVTDGPNARIMGLVDESQRAHHAGQSYWKGNTALNGSSIGIEIVNPGFRRLADGTPVWAAFEPKQIELVIALVKDIAKRHGVAPERVLGHSDIAPQRKEDPGPMFPWKQLADAGLVQWPDATVVARKQPDYEAKLPDVAWFQRKLAVHGFQVPQNGVLDAATLRVLSAFQMKYRPSKFDGIPDAQTAALLAALTGSAD